METETETVHLDFVTKSGAHVRQTILVKPVDENGLQGGYGVHGDTVITLSGVDIVLSSAQMNLLREINGELARQAFLNCQRKYREAKYAHTNDEEDF